VDRGYGQPAVEHDLQEVGVRTVAIPRQATTSAARKNRTRLDGKKGAAICCGHGVFAHNLVKISILAA